MTSRAPSKEHAFNQAKEDAQRSAEIIETNLAKVVNNLAAIKTVLPGNEPLKAELDLLNKALTQAKRLHSDGGLDALLTAHEEWLKA